MSYFTVNGCILQAAFFSHMPFREQLYSPPPTSQFVLYVNVTMGGYYGGLEQVGL